MKLKNNVSPKRLWVKLLVIAMLIAVVFTTNPLQPAQAATSSTWQEKHVGNYVDTLDGPYDPRIAVASNGYLYTAVRYTNAAGDNKIVVRRSTNGGSTWSSYYTYNAGPGIKPEKLDIGIDLYNNYVYVVYQYSLYIPLLKLERKLTMLELLFKMQ